MRVFNKIHNYKKAEQGDGMRNSEWYSDPTAGMAMGRVRREAKRSRKKAGAGQRITWVRVLTRMEDGDDKRKEKGEGRE